MSTIPSYSNGPQNNGKVFAGLILLAVGSLLLLRQFDFFFFPSWIFSFPMLLIVIGLYNGAKHNFKNPAWFIMILIGVVFLSGRIMPFFDLRAFIWPICIIALGLWLILRRNQQNFAWKKKEQVFDTDAFNAEADYTVKPDGYVPPKAAYNAKGDDYIDSVSVFGGVKKVILSKDFKGGEIVNIFGGAELDFSQSDINGTVIIEVTQIFGGVKLIVPPHWQVTSDVAAIFAGVDDKRYSKHNQHNPLSPDKLLVIKGVSVFAGIDIRSF